MKTFLFLVLLTLSSFSQTANSYALDFIYENDEFCQKDTVNWRIADTTGFWSQWIKWDGDLAFLGFTANNGAAERRLQCSIGADGSVNIIQRNNDTRDWVASAAGTLVADSIYHIVYGTLKLGTEYGLWVNGDSVGLSVTSGANNGDWINALSGGNPVNVGIGGYLGQSNGVSTFDGIIDEVSYFTSDIRQSLVDSLYTNGHPSYLRHFPDLLEYWSFSEGTGETLVASENPYMSMTLGLTSSTDGDEPTWITSPFGWTVAADTIGYPLSDATLGTNQEFYLSLGLKDTDGNGTVNVWIGQKRIPKTAVNTFTFGSSFATKTAYLGDGISLSSDTLWVASSDTAAIYPAPSVTKITHHLTGNSSERNSNGYGEY